MKNQLPLFNQPHSLRIVIARKDGMPARHGHLWTVDDQLMLGRLIDANAQIDVIAISLQRTISGVVSKAMQICRRQVLLSYLDRHPKSKGRTILSSSLYWAGKTNENYPYRRVVDDL